MAVLTIAATFFVDSSTETNRSFDKMLNAPALMDTMASPGVDGVDDRKASTCSSSKNFRDCVEADMMNKDTAKCAGVIVSDGPSMGGRLYIYIMELNGIEAIMTSSLVHAGDLSQAAAPL